MAARRTITRLEHLKTKVYQGKACKEEEAELNILHKEYMLELAIHPAPPVMSGKSLRMKRTNIGGLWRGHTKL